MFVLGIGLGCVMQVLVLIVQNAVPHGELGVATSGATFFRSIGGSFGTAIFGAIFSNVLAGNLAKQLGTARLPSGLVELERHAGDPRQASARRSTTTSPWPTRSRSRQCSGSPCRSRAIAFLAAWLIPQVELRRRVEAPPDSTPAQPATL